MSLLGLIIAVVSLDLWSKWAIKSSLRLYQSKPIIQDFFHLTYVTNDGMAFGLSFPGGKFFLLSLILLLTGLSRFTDLTPSTFEVLLYFLYPVELSQNDAGSVILLGIHKSI